MRDASAFLSCRWSTTGSRWSVSPKTPRSVSGPQRGRVVEAASGHDLSAAAHWRCDGLDNCSSPRNRGMAGSARTRARVADLPREMASSRGLAWSTVEPKARRAGEMEGAPPNRTGRIGPRRARGGGVARRCRRVLGRRCRRLGPFAGQRLAEARWRLSSGGELSNWCVNVATCATLNAVRMKLMRHRAMHRGHHQDEAAQQVQQAARDTLDGVYEVVPRWLPGTSAVWEAFRDARNHYDGLIGGWNQTSGLPTVDAARLTSP